MDQTCLSRSLYYSSLLLSALLAWSATADSRPVMGPPKDGHARPPLHINLAPATSVSYSPAQIRHAYGFDQLSATGSGQTIAIVDAYGNASIQSDLDTFCNQFGLSQTTVKVLGNNTSSDTGWAMETALDVEWAHAIAPGATIMLSVANSSSVTDLLSAVDAAVSAGATVVSMSWGGNDFSGESSFDGHFDRSGVTFTASSGDNGAGVEWPASSPYVIAVGGTSLYLDGSDNRSSETAWSGSGGGSSLYQPFPTFQLGWQSSTGRGVPDVSYVADPNTGVLVYDSVNGSWFVVGGTSAGAPQWAGLIALVNELQTSGSLTAPNPDLYAIAQGSSTTPYSIDAKYFYDVSSGNNGRYSSVAGYDFVTGLGSPVANNLVPAFGTGGSTPTPTPTPPPPADFTISVSPSSRVAKRGASASYTVTIGAVNGFTGTVSLSATVSPNGPSASFSPNSVSGSGTSVMTVTTTSTPKGSYSITITGSSGVQHSTSASLRVN